MNTPHLEWPWCDERCSLARLLPVRSNILTFLLSYGTAIRPDTDTLILFTALSDRMVATAVLMFLRSHTLADLSSDQNMIMNMLEVTSSLCVG